MKCPACHLENPDTATHCDCGYSLTGSKMDPNYYLRSIADSARTIKRVVVCWAVLTVIGMIVWLGATFLAGPQETQVVRPFQEKPAIQK
jgi:hypothetical protein